MITFNNYFWDYFNNFLSSFPIWQQLKLNLDWNQIRHFPIWVTEFYRDSNSKREEKHAVHLLDFVGVLPSSVVWLSRAKNGFLSWRTCSMNESHNAPYTSLILFVWLVRNCISEGMGFMCERWFCMFGENMAVDQPEKY